jgi:hypothetical protein
MQDQLRKISIKLNRLYKLYSSVVEFGKPHQISRVRKIYKDYIDSITKEIKIHNFDSTTYKNLYRENPSLEKVLHAKEDAVKIGNLEYAAALRDKERVILWKLTLPLKVKPTDHFFSSGGNLYFLP